MIPRHAFLRYYSNQMICVMKYALYVIAAIMVIYWAVALFALHGPASISLILILAVACLYIGTRYGHGHFLE